MAVFTSRKLVVPDRGVQASDLEIGSSVFLNVNGTPTEFLVVHQGNPDSSKYDASCDGVWLLMKDCYVSSKWNSYSSSMNSYSSSTIHSYLNGTFLGLLDDSFKSAIKQVKIPYRSGYGSTGTDKGGADGLTASVFLLSKPEVFDYYAAEDANIGVTLDYFNLDYTLAPARRITYLNGEQIEWWTRSPYTTDKQKATAVNADGTSLYYMGANISYGIRPAMIIRKDAIIDPDTLEFKGVA